jgi:tetratricopeptide (TPR) repeat protein
MNPTKPQEFSRSSSPVPDTVSRVVHALQRRAHVESHDVYVRTDTQLPEDLIRECLTLYRELRYEEGIARARRDPGWQHEPFARLYVAIGMHYQSRYDDARAEYAEAVARFEDISLRAMCVANIGSTFYEQGDLITADVHYKNALTMDERNEFALVARVGLACQCSDEAAVMERAATLRAHWPTWRERSVIAEQLLKDRSYRFLRETPGLFERAMGVSLEHLLLR